MQVTLQITQQGDSIQVTDTLTGQGLLWPSSDTMLSECTIEDSQLRDIILKLAMGAHSIADLNGKTVTLSLEIS